jgi:hypothetical protein
MSAGEVIAPKEETQHPVSMSKTAEPCVVADAGALCTPAAIELRNPAKVALAPPPPPVLSLPKPLLLSFLRSPPPDGGLETIQRRPSRRMHGCVKVMIHGSTACEGISTVARSRIGRAKSTDSGSKWRASKYAASPCSNAG